MGLLDWDFNDPRNQGLLAMSLNMMANSGPSTQKRSMGQIMGTSGMAGLQAMNAAKQAQAEEEMRKMQMKKFQFGMDKDQFEMDQLKAAAAEEKRLKDFLGNYSAGGMTQPLPTMGASGMGGSIMAGKGDMPAWTPQRQDAPAVQPMNDYSRMMDLARQLEAKGFSKQAKERYDMAAKFMPKVKNWEKVNVGGKVMFTPYFEDGSAGNPVPFEVAEKLHFADNGQNIYGLDAYTGKPVSKLGKQQTLESIASNAVTMRGQNMTDARARELNAITREGQQTQVVVDPIRGPILINKGTGVARNAVGADGRPIQGEIPAKRENAAKSLVPILDEAEKLIGGATGSYVGAGIDQTARLVGAATPGDRNIAQLKVLEGSIMMNQPRMEGPQSDKDVAMYRQMAGQIGDPTIPTPLKKDALAVIRRLNQKYSNTQSGGASGDWDSSGSNSPAAIDALLKKYGG